jgi:alpha-ketoglutarate-dependent 2,4-dichlorophenoxyacetate dioxygenase
MAISVTALHQSFVGEVSGVDLCSPVKVDFLEISEALDRYAVLVFRDQQLTDEQQIAFSRLFGSLETSIGTIRKDRKHRLPSSVLADISNLDDNNNIRSTSDRWRMMMLANQLWHTDSSFKRVPGKISLLSAHEVPPYGGETEFADLRAATTRSGRKPRSGSKTWLPSIRSSIREASLAIPSFPTRSAPRFRPFCRPSFACIRAPDERHSI